MIVKRISVAQARANFSNLLGGVHYSKEEVIVERKGKPFAVVISPEQYQSLKAQQEAAFQRLDQLAERNADKDPNEEVEAVRQERYEQPKAAKTSSR